VQERLPIWIGGNRPASLRRAARWDGWIADGADPTGMTLSPDDVARSIDAIGRTGDYVVALLAQLDRGDPGAYEQAGVAWWLENVNDQRGAPEKMLELVRAGPPR
jgi:hypothetical protein